MHSPTLLQSSNRLKFDRNFHVEILKGGMNRLLLRSLPCSAHPTRIEIFFQYVQYLEMPMKFSGVSIVNLDAKTSLSREIADVLRRFPSCRAFELTTLEGFTSYVVAASCSSCEDLEAADAQSAFFMMD